MSAAQMKVFLRVGVVGKGRSMGSIVMGRNRGSYSIGMGRSRDSSKSGEE